MTKPSKTVALLAMCLGLMLSCSAEIVGTLPEESPSAPAGAVFEVEPFGASSIKLKFTPAPFADIYYASFDTGGEAVELSSLGYEDGLLTTTVDTPGGALSGKVYLTAVTSTNAWSVIGSEDYLLSLEGTAPEAYLSRRGETEAEIRIDSPLAAGSEVIYKVEVSPEPSLEPQEFYFTDVIVIEGLDPDTGYTFTVSHALVSDGAFSEAVTKVEAGAYDSSVSMTISLGLEDGTFVAEGIESATTAELWKEGGSSALLTAAVEDGAASFATPDLKSLESGLFYVKAGDGESNRIKHITPIMVKSVEESWKSARLGVDFADDVDTEALELSVTGGAADAEAGDGYIRVTGLDSNREYPSIVVSAGGGYSGAEASIVPGFTTRSFAGTYLWEGYFEDDSGKKNFKIVVEDAPEDSSYPYYVYFHEDDQAAPSDGSRVRIMPLYDESLPGAAEMPASISTSNPQDEFKEANTAYLTNSGKWNKTTMVPSSWTISDPDADSGRDAVKTVTSSKAFMVTVTTTTSFAFIEVEKDESMAPYVKFSNVGSGVAAYGMAKNATPQTDIDPSATSTDWYLAKVGE